MKCNCIEKGNDEYIDCPVHGVRLPDSAFNWRDYGGRGDDLKPLRCCPKADPCPIHIMAMATAAANQRDCDVAAVSAANDFAEVKLTAWAFYDVYAPIVDVRTPFLHDQAMEFAETFAALEGRRRLPESDIEVAIAEALDNLRPAGRATAPAVTPTPPQPPERPNLEMISAQGRQLLTNISDVLNVIIPRQQWTRVMWLIAGAFPKPAISVRKIVDISQEEADSCAAPAVEARPRDDEWPEHDHFCVGCSGSILGCDGKNCWGKFFVCIRCQPKYEPVEARPATPTQILSIGDLAGLMEAGAQEKNHAKYLKIAAYVLQHARLAAREAAAI